MPQKGIDKTWIYHLKLIDSAIKDFEKHRFQQSIIKTRQAIWTEVNNADAYYFLYLCQASQKTKQIVNKKMLEKAKLMNPLCQIYDLDPKDSIKILKRIVESSIKFETSILEQKGNLIINNWYNYSVMLHEQTDYQRVEDMYQRLFRKYPELYTTKSHAFLGNYANMLYDIGKYDEAVKLYEIQITLDPNQFRYFSNCAMLYTILGNYHKAQQYIKTALDGLPNRTSFIFNYANVLAKTGRYELSIQYIKKAILKEPIDPIFRLKFSLTIMLADIKQCQLDICRQNLKKSAHTFSQSIKNKKLDMVNCNKRILSMSNTQYLNIYTCKIIQIVEAEFLTWKYFKFILETVSDYLIVGQATKLELNVKILKIVEETFNSLDQEIIQDSISASTQKVQQVGKSDNKELGGIKSRKKEKLKQIFGDWLQKLRNQRKPQQNVNI